MSLRCGTSYVGQIDTSALEMHENHINEHWKKPSRYKNSFSQAQPFLALCLRKALSLLFWGKFHHELEYIRDPEKGSFGLCTNIGQNRVAILKIYSVFFSL